MGKLIFVNRFFYPDLSATSQLLSDLAIEFAGRGRTVVVITSRTAYHGPSSPLAPVDLVEGVRVFRTASTRFGRDRAITRLSDYLTFYLSSVWRLLRCVRPGDVVIGMTDPPMLNVATLCIAKLRGARHVAWLQDIFPDVARQASAGTQYRYAAAPVTSALGWLARRANRASDAAVVLGEGMRDRMLAARLRPERIRLISNWSDLERLEVLPRGAPNPLRAAWAPNDEFIVGYSGNMGVAHDLRPLLAAAEQCRANRGIRFVLIGEGKQRHELETVVRERGLDNVSFQPYQPRERLQQSLGAIDLHVVSLRPAMEGLVVPSKFFGIAAAGRPTLFLGAADGEIARLLRAHQCGLTVAGDDVAAITGAIANLASDPSRCEAMGRAARALAEREFSLARTLEQWNGLLSELEAGPDRGLPRPMERAQAPERQ